MKVRNIINKAAVIGTGALMTGLTVSSALAYDLANYPTQFIVDGEFDGKIVVGEQAATSDVLGSIDIAASLQAGSVTEEAVEVPGETGGVSLSGDAFKVEASNDMLELREPLGSVFETLTSDEIEALAGGRITTSRGATDYQQFLRLGDRSMSEDLQPIAANFVENRDRESDDYLVVDDGMAFFEWEAEFSQGFKSRVRESGSNNAGELRDFPNKNINIFGTDYTVVTSRMLGTNFDEGVELELMAGDASDVMREGETRTYTIDGVDYEVTAVFISHPSTGQSEARLSVNGEMTTSLEVGETIELASGITIGVRDILVSQQDAIVEFFLGADKLLLRDGDFSNSDTSGNDGHFEASNRVEYGNNHISDASVAIEGQMSGNNEFEINAIRYRYGADNRNVYVPAGYGVRDFLDEPRGMLSPTFDIRFEGLTEPSTTPVEFRSRSDHSYELTVTNLRGAEFANVPFATIRNVADLTWGDDRDAFWFAKPAVAGDFSGNIASIADEEAFWINWDDYFVVTDSTRDADKRDSAIFIYDDIDTDDRQLTFTSAADGSERVVTYTEVAGNDLVLGEGDLRVDGRNYKVLVANSSAGIANENYPLAVDLNRNGEFDGSTASFTTHGGAVLDFGTQEANGTSGDKSIAGNETTVSLSVPETLFDTSNGDEQLNWTIDLDGTGDEVRLSLSESDHMGPLANASFDDWGHFSLEDDGGDNEYGRLDYGAMVEYRNPSGDSQSLLISMPSEQVSPQVFVTSGAVERGVGGSGSVSRDRVNPIAVGMAVLDTDAQGMYGNENLIIVGGPCANSVASQFLGNPENCAEGFTPGRAGIWAQESNGNVAILVAGYEAQETLGAAYVLSDYETYLADVEGSEVEVVATDLSDLQVSAPSAAEDEDME